MKNIYECGDLIYDHKNDKHGIIIKEKKLKTNETCVIYFSEENEKVGQFSTFIDRIQQVKE
jgi:hypothetical protein